MNSKIEQLVAQRNALVNQAAYQRIELAEAFETVSKPVKLLDHGFFAVRYLVKHPLILAGAVALAGATRPKRWLRIVETGLLAWRIGLEAKRSLQKQKD